MRQSILFIFLLTVIRCADAADAVNVADSGFACPANWERKFDATSQRVVWTPPETDAAVSFVPSQPFTGAATDWHRQVWSQLVGALKPNLPGPDELHGKFDSSSGSYLQPDGVTTWIKLYTTVQDGRGEAVLFSAKTENLFQKYATEIDQSVEHPNATAATVALAPTPDPPAVAVTPALEPITQAPEGSSQSNAAPSAFAPNVPLPAELALNLPADWTRQLDPQQRATYFLPPGIHDLQQAGVILFPAIESNAEPADFHNQAVKSTLANSRQSGALEPARRLSPHGFLVSKFWNVSQQGLRAWTSLYTVRWGTRAQAVAFVALREDDYRKYDAFVERMVASVPLPEPAPASIADVIHFSPSSTNPNPVTQDRSNAGPNRFAPVLSYNEPEGFSRGAGQLPVDYRSNDGKCSIQVYQFRHYAGNVEAAFRQNLLSEWVQGDQKEIALMGPPRFGENHMPGADRVIDARFREAAPGSGRDRMRILIIAGDRAALVDITASNAALWAKYLPRVQAMLGTLHVDR